MEKETDGFALRLEELLAARDVARQSGNEQMMSQVNAGLSQVAGQMQQAGIQDPEAVLYEYQARKAEEQMQNERVNQAGRQGAALGQKQGMEQGYRTGYDAGNPVGAAAKRLAESLGGENQAQPMERPQFQ